MRPEKPASLLKMPAVLGFLIAGMVLGPNAFGLLPHFGVSLVLTGIAVSSLTGEYSAYEDIVQGTIAAAAVINEGIAVFVAHYGFQLAGGIGQKNRM